MGTSAVFALLWVLSHKMENGLVGILFLALGAGAIASGLWIRKTHWVCRSGTEGSWHSNTSALLIVYGLAAMTTSPLVLLAVGFACMALWLSAIGRNDDQAEEPPGWSVIRESALIGGLVIAILILIDARGVLPFQ
jgi:undecaprenyl-diphosphatase